MVLQTLLMHLAISYKDKYIVVRCKSFDVSLLQPELLTAYQASMDATPYEATMSKLPQSASRSSEQPTGILLEQAVTSHASIARIEPGEETSTISPVASALKLIQKVTFISEHTLVVQRFSLGAATEWQNKCNNLLYAAYADGTRADVFNVGTRKG